MEGLTALSALLARGKRAVRELFFWQELRLQFRWQGRQVTGFTARQRAACSLREGGLLVARDGCTRTQVAHLLGVKPHSVPPWSWEGELALPDPHTVAAQLPPITLQVGVTGSRVAVVRPDGVFACTRPVVVDCENQAGETFTWVWGQAVPPLEPAKAGNAAPPTGRLRALLHPQPAAVLCHELFGHPLEADAFFSGHSPWVGKLGTRVVTAPLTVVDDPTAALPGGFHHDDEGERARRKVLVAAGTVKGLLADRTYGATFAAEPGNARRLSPHYTPYPRLSNVIAWVEEGMADPPLAEARLEIVRVRSGLLLPGERALLLSVSESYLLARGSRRVCLSSYFLRLPLDGSGLRIVAGGSSPVPAAEPGWCGKGHQLLPAGAAAGWLLLDRVEVA